MQTPEQVRGEEGRGQAWRPKRRPSKVLDQRRRDTRKPPTADQLELLVQDYVADLRLQDKSPATYENYRHTLTRVLVPWMRAQGLQSWDELTQARMSEYRRHLFGREDLAPASANTYVRHTNTFMKWLYNQREVPQEVKGRLLKAEPSRADAVLSDQELELLLAKASNVRDRLVIQVLSDTGIRVSELATLRHDAVIHHHDYSGLKVLEKAGDGWREREVPVVMPGVLRTLEQYIRLTGGRSNEQPYVFQAKIRDRRSGEYEAITTNGLQQMLRHLGRRAGIPRPVTPHVLRHTFITRALLAGVPEVVIAQIVGHKDLRMIQKHYAHIRRQDAYDLLQKALLGDRQRPGGREGPRLPR